MRQPRGSNLRDVLPEVNPGDGNRADKLWEIRDALAELRKVPAHLRDLLRGALHVEDDACEHAVERSGGGAARAPANLARGTGTPRARPGPPVLAGFPRASIERRESLVVNLFGHLVAVLDRDARAQVVDERALRLVAVLVRPVAAAVAIPRAVAADTARSRSRSASASDAPGPLREPRRRPRRGEHRRVHHGPRARDILPQRHRPRLFRGVAERVAPHHPVTLVQRALGVREDDWQALPPALLLPRADRPSPGSVPGDAVLRPRVGTLGVFEPRGVQRRAQSNVRAVQVDGARGIGGSVSRELELAVGERGEGALAALGFLRRGRRVGAPDEDEPSSVVLLIRPRRVPLALLGDEGSHRGARPDLHGARELVRSLGGGLGQREADEDGLDDQCGADAHENPARVAERDGGGVRSRKALLGALSPRKRW